MAFRNSNHLDPWKILFACWGLIDNKTRIHQAFRDDVLELFVGDLHAGPAGIRVKAHAFDEDLSGHTLWKGDVVRERDDDRVLFGLVQILQFGFGEHLKWHAVSKKCFFRRILINHFDLIDDTDRSRD